MSPDIENPRESQEDEQPVWRQWLPWIALALVLLLAILLFGMFGDFATRQTNKVVTEAPERLVSVPDVTGMEEQAAEDLLLKAGLTSEIAVSYDTLSPAGTVASQEPASGSQVRLGSSVVLGVVEETLSSQLDEKDEPDYNGEAKGFTERPARTADLREVPSLVGKESAEAAAAVEAAGLKVRFMYQPIPESIGVVYEQSPAPGTSVPAGGQVHMLVGVNP